MTKPDEEFAFARPANPRDHMGQTQKGMTLRDYFAAKAMQSLMNTPMEPALAGQVTAEILAKSAYAMADEMLKARKQ
jgi:hypothetical protein